MGVVESISYKNAIVSTKSDGGISDLVLHQFSGLLVPKNDYKLFAKAIELLINDEKLRSTYANNGISLLDAFSNEEIIKKWFNVLKINNN
jgi:glycosyltransferase involved in cell wall biosynthesis